MPTLDELFDIVVHSDNPSYWSTIAPTGPTNLVAWHEQPGGWGPGLRR